MVCYLLLAQSTADQLKEMDFEVILPEPSYYLSWIFVTQTFCGRTSRWEKPSGSVPLWSQVSRCSFYESYRSLVTIMSSDWPALSIGGDGWWLWLGWGITGDASHWECLPGSLHIFCNPDLYCRWCEAVGVITITHTSLCPKKVILIWYKFVFT